MRRVVDGHVPDEDVGLPRRAEADADETQDGSESERDRIHVGRVQGGQALVEGFELRFSGFVGVLQSRLEVLFYRAGVAPFLAPLPKLQP